MSQRRRTFVRLLGEIRHKLAQALEEEHSAHGLTKAEMARLLGRHPSFITRKLNGTSNMTLETLADLAWALDRPVRISLPARRSMSANYVEAAETTADSSLRPGPSTIPTTSSTPQQVVHRLQAAQ